MADKTIVANPSVIMNNTPISIVPNSFSFTEGKGEQNVRTQSAGGGSVSVVVSNNVETNKSGFKFSLYPTAENIELAREWKNVPGENAAGVVFPTFTRSFNDVTLVNNYEVALGADTTIDLEFEGAPAA